MCFVAAREERKANDPRHHRRTLRTLHTYLHAIGIAPIHRMRPCLLKVKRDTVGNPSTARACGPECHRPTPQASSITPPFSFGGQAWASPAASITTIHDGFNSAARSANLQCPLHKHLQSARRLSSRCQPKLCADRTAHACLSNGGSCTVSIVHV